MKSSVVNFDPSDNIPGLWIAEKNQKIVLIYDKPLTTGHGVVVHQGDSGDNVGYHSTGWVMSQFVPFRGSVQLDG